MKIFGVLFVLAASLTVSVCWFLNEKKSVANLEKLCDFVAFAGRQIENSRSPLDMIILDYSIGRENMNIDLRACAPADLPKILSELSPALSFEISRTFETVFDSATGASAVLSQLESACFERLKNEKENFEKKKKSIVLLPLIVGAMVIILLI